MIFKFDSDLDELTNKRISKIIEEAFIFEDNDDYLYAKTLYEEAISYLPEPKESLRMYGFLNTCIAEILFDERQYRDCIDIMKSVRSTTYHLTNPLILLIIGKCYYELDELDLSADYLMRAYLLEGIDIFKGEDLYKDFLEEYLRLENTNE